MPHLLSAFSAIPPVAAVFLRPRRPLPHGRGSEGIVPLRPLPYGRGSDRMLDLHKELAAAKTPAAESALQRQIDATDRQIDQVVYELYGLTDEEIRIVEEATAR